MAKRKKKTQRLPRTTRAGRVQRRKEMLLQVKKDLAAMAPETIVHVGEDLVLTEQALQQEVQAYREEMKTGLGLRFEDSGVEVAYEMTRASLGLNQTMTAGELLAQIEAQA